MFLVAVAAMLAAPVEKTWLPPPPGPQFREGIYAGSFGGAELRACHSGLGIRYFEMGSFRVLSLYQQTPQNVWARRADSQTGASESWTVTAREDGAIDVVRSNAGVKVSGQLKPMAAATVSEPSCSGDDFIGPKLRAVETETTLASFADEAIWRVVRNPGPGFPLADMQSIELDGTRPGDEEINALLRREASLWSSQFDHVACERRNIDANGASTTFRLRHDPVMLNRRFASLRFRYEVECGNMLRRGNEVRLFDRTSGEQVDPAQWFTSEAIKPAGQGGGAAYGIPGFELAEKLQVLGGGGRKTCLFDAIARYPAIVTVQPGGFAFERADLGSGDCNPVILPWLQAIPMLNPQGKAIFVELARQKRPAKDRAPAGKPLVDY
jgi:hypothetical protein